MKLQEAARSALNTELGRLTTAGKDPGQGISMDEGASTPGTQARSCCAPNTRVFEGFIRVGPAATQRLKIYTGT